LSLAGTERVAEGLPPSVQVAAAGALAAKRSLPRRVLRALPVAWVALIVLGGLFGRVLGRSPTEVTSNILLGPGTHHLMGTDELGRDVLARVLSGASTSVRVAGFAVLVALLVGSPLGLVAATTHRIVDEGIMRSMDVVLAFPALVLALLVSVLLGSSLIYVALLIGFIISPHIARLVRGRLATELKQGYVTAERSTGAPMRRILFVHVSRNIVAPIGAYCLLLFADSMLFEAALSFVGVGIQPPTASWGNMVLEGQRLLVIGGWWVSVFPGMVLFLTVAAINILGDRWVTELDPLLRQRAA
jgi:peptide/nickel transport system ATP-binding protein/peptide/nickel transport system permease protein